MNLRIRPFTAPPFGENTYVAWQDGAAEGVCVDPGNVITDVLAFLDAEKLAVVAILLTHAHLDHVDGVAELVRSTGAPVYLHPDDRPLYDHVSRQAAQFGLRVEEPPTPDHTLAHGQAIEFAGVEYQVRHVPGHSPGHVLFHVEEARCAFVGDVVFQGSIGRTDLPGGDYAQLIASIRAHVLTLPDDTHLLPGHGPATTVAHERTTNPFLIPHYGGGLA
ncbi:MAG TPA: MBL fold metallo-hydrolase [Longimicrobiales bacterium]|nr:MBL fold metallo-hydrolase [Longimicrobiales bacterium]